MKIIAHTFFAMSIISWIGLLPCLIAIKILSLPYKEQVAFYFSVMLLVMGILALALVIFYDV
jgi:uncharacterized membrane protein